ncbi:menaquinone biosynthesis protein [Pedobacter sp. P351]|uniref:menaquinone biosynthetic enzyme MqnA/MqnD family protein n=1 Tax=Pedobacter superstes TaxID=3133441 RepID=UPI0030ACC161
MSKIRVSAVSYTNTKPFVYGLQQSGILDKIDLSLDIPSDCAKKLIDNQVDIGLIPVAALLNVPGYEIISDYCIGADGAVNSVFIFSDKPINEIKTIRLDLQSRTSNALAKVLLKNYWKLSPEYITSNSADAFVEIGDRTFGKKDKYSFVYDLAEEWKNFTGLQFAFAVWASNKPISPAFITEFNAALRLGIENISCVISELPERKDFNLDDYLRNKLDYSLTDSKMKALELFLNYLKPANKAIPEYGQRFEF